MPIVIAVLHPGGLVGRVVRHFLLEKDVGAALAAPDHFVLLVVLYEKPMTI